MTPLLDPQPTRGNPTIEVDQAWFHAAMKAQSRCLAWADVVQLYGDKTVIDAATNAGLWPEQNGDPL